MSREHGAAKAVGAEAGARRAEVQVRLSFAEDEWGTGAGRCHLSGAGKYGIGAGA